MLSDDNDTFMFSTHHIHITTQVWMSQSLQLLEAPVDFDRVRRDGEAIVTARVGWVSRCEKCEQPNVRVAQVGRFHHNVIAVREKYDI